MELYKEMYFKIKHDAKTDLTNEEITRIVENKCYVTLCEIRDILRNPGFDDDQCFDKIEEIVYLFEKLGSSGGSRHDFG